jgi:hypothetical protein
MKSVKWSKPGYASITCSTISNIPYDLILTTKFNDSSILITIISCDYLNLSLADEHVGDVTIPTQLSSITKMFSRRISQSDWNIQIKWSFNPIVTCQAIDKLTEGFFNWNEHTI